MILQVDDLTAGPSTTRAVAVITGRNERKLNCDIKERKLCLWSAPLSCFVNQCNSCLLCLCIIIIHLPFNVALISLTFYLPKLIFLSSFPLGNKECNSEVKSNILYFKFKLKVAEIEVPEHLFYLTIYLSYYSLF